MGWIRAHKHTIGFVALMLVTLPLLALVVYTMFQPTQVCR